MALEPAATETAIVERREGPPVRFGLTEPISLGYPTQEELALNGQLLDEMRRDAPLESQEGMRFRASVLVELERVVLQWIYEVGMQQGLGELAAREAGAKIFTFGSYRLGLVSPGSDIDALCVAPRHVSRDAFFQVLVPKLNEHPDISELSPVPDAYVPIIKLKFSGVEIDLLFARLALPQIPNELESLTSDNLLKNLDDRTVRSLNGCRVADQILDLVPDREQYRGALRLVKIWAKKRGIYSNVLGFFGGITWAILVAKVCQLYPYYCSASIVKRFFRVYDRWNWKNPVAICSIREESTEPGLIAFKVWNPKVHPQDGNHLMPIITPAFPSMNSTHNVTDTTRRILLEEFSRGFKVADQVEKGRCDWSEVYRGLPFFGQYKHYLHIVIVAKTSQLFSKWVGWIESKLRTLVKSLEQIPSVQVRPWPDHIKFEDPTWPFAKAVFMGLVLDRKGPDGQKGHTVDLREPVTKFVEFINSWGERAGTRDLCDMRVQHVKRRDLPEYAPDPDGSRAALRRGSGGAPAAKHQLGDSLEDASSDAMQAAKRQRLNAAGPEGSGPTPGPAPCAAAAATPAASALPPAQAAATQAVATPAAAAAAPVQAGAPAVAAAVSSVAASPAAPATAAASEEATRKREPEAAAPAPAATPAAPVKKRGRIAVTLAR